MPDDEREDGDHAGPKRSRSDVGNRTMQIDALAELQDALGEEVPDDAVLAEVLPDEDGAAGPALIAPQVPATSLPPPLPRRRAGRAVLVVGVVVVLLAAGLGLLFGDLLTSGGPAVSPATPPTEPEAAPEPAAVPIRLDEVVIGAEEQGVGAQDEEDQGAQAQGAQEPSAQEQGAQEQGAAGPR